MGRTGVEATLLHRLHDQQAIVLHTFGSDGSARVQTLARMLRQFVDLNNAVQVPVGEPNEAGLRRVRVVLTRKQHWSFSLGRDKAYTAPVILERLESSIPRMEFAPTNLYPIRLSVSYMKTWLRNEEEDITVDDDLAIDISRVPSQGAIYISTDRDIFVYGFCEEADWYHSEYYYQEYPLGGSKKVGWRSPSLSQSQCRDLRQTLEFKIFCDAFRVDLDECSSINDCVIKCKTNNVDDTWYDSTVFSGVKRLLWRVYNEDTADGISIYLNIFERSRRPWIWKDLEQDGWL
ncbi:hypothetical protein F5Y03DRAFT_399274 [Xylaria venustula]|nr:hypothetical protein F5Y03DRAFT_399274 [Xylaria venustula]